MKVKFLLKNDFNYIYGKVYEVDCIVSGLYCVVDEYDDPTCYYPDCWEIVEGSPDDVDHEEFPKVKKHE